MQFSSGHEENFTFRQSFVRIDAEVTSPKSRVQKSFQGWGAATRTMGQETPRTVCLGVIVHSCEWTRDDFASARGRQASGALATALCRRLLCRISRFGYTQVRSGHGNPGQERCERLNRRTLRVTAAATMTTKSNTHIISNAFVSGFKLREVSEVKLILFPAARKNSDRRSSLNVSQSKTCIP